MITLESRGAGSRRRGRLDDLSPAHRGPAALWDIAQKYFFLCVSSRGISTGVICVSPCYLAALSSLDSKLISIQHLGRHKAATHWLFCFFHYPKHGEERQEGLERDKENIKERDRGRTSGKQKEQSWWERTKMDPTVTERLLSGSMKACWFTHIDICSPPHLLNITLSGLFCILPTLSERLVTASFNGQIPSGHFNLLSTRCLPILNVVVVINISVLIQLSIQVESWWMCAFETSAYCLIG